MNEQDLLQQAATLGMDHAESDHRGDRGVRLHSGRDVAAALGIDDAGPDLLVALRESYASGWTNWA
ncbi:hypothetical protein [Microbacterium sp.]|uniref:hypothetical protein n=1 Tax=Microbacterium sp. TaxID=51671 RepID=UPI00324202AC